MIQRRHFWQLVQEKEGQRLKREQGTSSFGTGEASLGWQGGQGLSSGEGGVTVAVGLPWEVTGGPVLFHAEPQK